MKNQASRFQEVGEKMNRMLCAWSPLLRDRIISFYVGAIDDKRRVDREDVISFLGFDPTDVDELKPPWRDPAFTSKG